MVLWIFRALFVLASAGTAFSVGLSLETPRPVPALLIGVAVSMTIILAEWFVSRGPIALISSIVFGSMLGMLFASLTVSVVGMAMDQAVLAQIRDSLTGSLIVVYSYLGIAFIYQSRDKFNLIVPYIEFRREEKGVKPVVVDTSVVIDGRLPELLRTGTFDCPVLVPQLVLHELHRIADSSDKLRRERGRLGLDALNELREDPDLDVRIHELVPNPGQPVDEQLVHITKIVNGRLMTNDYNLNRIASLEGVRVINLNSLSNALKPVALPDETISLKLIKKGEQPGQAVGFLLDGTMVIVEDADHLVGREVDVVVRNTITRETGRIIFARLVGGTDSRRGH